MFGMRTMRKMVGSSDVGPSLVRAVRSDPYPRVEVDEVYHTLTVGQ